MRIRDYIFRQLLWWTVGVAACLTGVVWLTQSLRYVDMIVNRGLSARLFAYFTALLLPSFLALILPLALFAAVLFTFSKLASDNELIVMRAAGVGQAGLARPALRLALIVTALGYVFSLQLIPASHRAFKDIEHAIRNMYSAVLLQEGVFSQIVDGVTVYVRSRTPEGELLGIMVHDKRDPGRPVTLMAERGAIVARETGPRVLMENGTRQEISGETGQLSLLHFDRYTFDFDRLTEVTGADMREPQERYLGELLRPSPGSLRNFGRNRLLMEAHDRLAFPLLGLAFALVGLACLITGGHNPRGQFTRVVLAVGAVMALETAYFAVKSAGVSRVALWPLLYAIPIAAGGAAGLVLLADPRRRSAAPLSGSP